MKNEIQPIVNKEDILDVLEVLDAIDLIISKTAEDDTRKELSECMDQLEQFALDYMPEINTLVNL